MTTMTRDGVHCVDCGASSADALAEGRPAYERWWAEHGHISHALRELAQRAQNGETVTAEALMRLAGHFGG